MVTAVGFEGETFGSSQTTHPFYRTLRCKLFLERNTATQDLRFCHDMVSNIKRTCFMSRSRLHALKINKCLVFPRVSVDVHTYVFNQFDYLLA